MKDGKCIYCKLETNKLSNEDAFPLSLRQPNTPKWIIDNHLCQKCNSKFGTKLDVILSQRSPVGFIFDIIQRELGHNEPVSVNHYLNYLGVRALSPQMILTQYRDGQSSKHVVEENNKKYDTKSSRTDKWYTHDEVDDVFCLFGNTYIFTPKTAQQYFGRIDEFKSKYLTNYPDMRYDLRSISPEVGRGEQKFFDFFNAIQGDRKEMIPEDKNLPVEVFRRPITIIMDEKAKSLFFRSIAKLAFHCFLYHYPKYTGNETMFNGIKNFISRGSGMTARFVKGAVRNEEIADIVYEDEEHQHFFSYFIKDKNIGCQIDLFTGITAPDLSYGIVLAGDETKIPLSTRCVETFPFFVCPRSPLKKRIGSDENRGVPPKRTGLIQPAKMRDLLLLRNHSSDVLYIA